MVVDAAEKHLPFVISFRHYGHIFNSIQIYLRNSSWQKNNVNVLNEKEKQEYPIINVLKN